MKKIALITVFFLFGCSYMSIEEKKPPIGAHVVEFPKMEVGEKWIVMAHDRLTDKYTKHIIEVSGVNKDGSFETTTVIPEYNRRIKNLYDNSYGRIASIDLVENQEVSVPRPPRNLLNFPLWVGKKWRDDKYVAWNKNDKRLYNYRNYYHVKAYKEIKTAAGTFKAFKISRLNHNLDSNNRWYRTYWYSPEVKRFVKYRAEEGDRFDLIKYIPIKQYNK
jgi:hypothetical protein